ncbi:MAG: glycoside hydrolase family 2 TIM barrel-domain containing protein [Spartobacteria bacterium]
MNTQKTSLLLALALFSALPLLWAESVAPAAEAPSEGLAWPTSGKVSTIDLFRQYGVKSGSVESTKRPLVYRNWGESSTVTWQVDNQIAGQYLPSIAYQSNAEAAYTLEVDGQRHEGVFAAAPEATKLELPPVAMNRTGINRVVLTVSPKAGGDSFILSGFSLKNAPGVVTVSKPVLIAGADWLKIQASIQPNSEAQIPPALKIQASIKPWPDGDVLWEGPVTATAVAGGFEIDQTIRDLKPKLWSPSSPNLYLVTLTVDSGNPEQPALQVQSRFGFRGFEAKDGRFYLNGKPVFLRGQAIVPPGGGHNRNLNPQLACDAGDARKYLEYLKAQNVNIVRAQDPLWQSLCDEVGMMVFVGRYGVPSIPGASREKPPAFDERAVDYYKQLFASDYMNNPSVVIWILTNEMPRPGTELGDEWLAFLKTCYEALKKWDPTRAYIATTGFGLGQTGDVNSFHAYLGWYNGLAQSAYKFREDQRALAGLSAPKQPMAFTETLGVYIDELGRMPAEDKQVASSVMWGGNAADVPEEAMGYQAYLGKELIEILRRIRSKNPDIAGIMPFTTSAKDWAVAQSFEEIPFLPLITKTYPVAYQPILLSFDNRWPHVYAGDTVRMPVHLVNDADDGRSLSAPVLEWRLTNKENGQEAASGKLPFAESVAHYATDAKQLELAFPKDLAAGTYILRGVVKENGKEVSHNETEILVERRGAGAPAFARRIDLFDPLRESLPILEKAGLVEGKDFFITENPFAAMQKSQDLTGQQLQETLAHGQLGGEKEDPAKTLLVIGSKQWLEPLRDNALLMRKFVAQGGRVLFLHPNAMALTDLGIHKEVMASGNEWIGDRASVGLESLWHTSRIFGAWINPRRSDTGIFSDIGRRQLRLWSDPSGWNLDKEGLPANEPVGTLLKLQDPEALGTTAVLANFGRGLEYLALAEVFRGKGSVILSGFDFDRFAGFDPVADKLLRNLLVYAADERQHTLVPVAKSTVKIGSPSDEDGFVPCEFRNGLLLEYNKDYQVRRIAGPFWFNRLCHTKLINPREKIRHAFLDVITPAGAKEAVFQVRRVKTIENHGKFTPEELVVSLDGTEVRETIAGEEEVTIRLPLAEGAGKPLHIEFAGTADMGISKVEFK